MKKHLLLIFTLLFALFLAACGGEDEKEENSTPEKQEIPHVEITEEEIVDEESAVVRVNGTEVKGAKYNNIYKQRKTMLNLTGRDISDLETLKEESIETLVVQELIKQDAAEQGIEVTEEEAQEEFEKIVETNGEEALQVILEHYELSEEDFRKQLVDDLTTAQYIESEFDVEVTEEEIEEQYNQLKERHEDIGELEEYEEMIRQSVAEKKQSELLEERVAELKEKAEIEKLI